MRVRGTFTAFYAVYDRLGYGFLESVYRTALANELRRRGILFEREVTIDVLDLGELDSGHQLRSQTNCPVAVVHQRPQALKRNGTAVLVSAVSVLVRVS